MQEEGFVAKLLYPEGAKDVPLGNAVAILVEDKADVAAFANYSPSSGGSAPAQSAPQATQAASPAPTQAAAQPAPSMQKSGSRIFVSPLAKRLAEEKGLDLSQIQGTGPNNRIIAADVNEFKAQPQAAAATPKAAAPSKAPSSTPADLPAEMFKDIENSNIRKIIATRLTESKQQIPHYYVTI